MSSKLQTDVLDAQDNKQLEGVDHLRRHTLEELRSSHDDKVGKAESSRSESSALSSGGAEVKAYLQTLETCNYPNKDLKNDILIHEISDGEGEIEVEIDDEF